MSDEILRIRSGHHDRFHEYRLGRGGVIEHRMALEDGGELADGSSIWTKATLDQLRQATRCAEKWFRERGVTFEGVLSQIDKQKEQQKSNRTRKAR